MNIVTISKRLISLIAVLPVLAALPLHGQTVSIYTGLGTNDSWTNSANWDTAFFPDASDAVAQFSQSVDTDRINMLATSGLLSIPTVHQTSGILVLDGFVATPVADGNFLFRNSSTGTPGFLRLHGFDTTINGNPVTGLVVNHSDQNISFATHNASFVIELAGSGHFHVEKPDVQTRVIVGITELEDTSHGITKTGAGILHFGAQSANSDYSGGFTMEEGIVQWTSSGSGSANPFGTGDLTLRGGNLRSTTSGTRSFYTSIVLDGDIEFGSLDEDFNGAFNVNSEGGTHSATILSDSTLTNHNNVNWFLEITGDFGLTKDGEGEFRLLGTGGDAEHTGPTLVKAGTLRVRTSIPNSEVTVESGATLAFGGTSDAGTGIFGQALTLEADSILSFRLNGAADFDSMVAQGLVSLGNGLGDVNLDIELGYQPDLNDVFVLIDNQGGSPLSGQVSFGGSTLAEGDEFTVNTGEFSQLFGITYLHGGDSLALTAIPEPSTWAFFAGLSVFALLAIRRRMR